MNINLQKGFAPLALLLLTVLAASGAGGYWYVRVYQPKVYARQIVSVWKDIEESGRNMGDVSPRSGDDYERISGTLKKQEELLKQTKVKLEKIQPPLLNAEMERTHEDFLLFVEVSSAIIAEVKNRAAFLESAKNLLAFIKSPAPGFDMRTKTVRDFQEFYEGFVKTIKTKGDNVFEVEPPSLKGNVTFVELKKSWIDTKAALDVILAEMKKEDPTKPATSFRFFRPPRPGEQGREALFRDPERFQKLLAGMLGNNSAYSALSAEPSEKILPPGLTTRDMENRMRAFQGKLNDLKKKYNLGEPSPLPPERGEPPAAEKRIPRESIQIPPAPQSVESPPEVLPIHTGGIVGLWKAEKMYGYNPDTKEWREGKLYQDIYYEYTSDGRTCTGYSTTQGFKCFNYDTYMVSGDIVSVQQKGLTGPPSRARWRVSGTMLDLTAEIFSNNAWLPFLRYEAKLVSYAATIPPPKTDFTPPVVRSLDVTVASNPATGKKEATLRCRVTDDTAIKIVMVNLRYAGENINWARTPEVIGADPKDQTWISSGFDAEKPGTHTAVCSASDKAGNISKEMNKTFIIP